VSRIVGLILALLSTAIAAQAEDLVFPPGSRIGLAPPPGFSAARTFAGFQNAAANASILLAEFPAGKFDEIRRGINADALAQKGLRLVSTESIEGIAFETVAVRAEQHTGNMLFDKWMMFFDAKGLVGMVAVTIPKSSPPSLQDSLIRSALASVKVRLEPVDAMAALPFTVESVARFKFRNPLAGRGLILKETPPPPEGRSDDVVFNIVLASDMPVAAADQKVFGAQQFLSMKSLSDQRIESAKPTEVAGIPGFEYLAQAKSATTGQPRRIIFVALYPAGRPFLLLGTAPPAKFDEVLPDFRAVIDSFRPKS
jgi:hypothetical protein